MEVKEQLVVPAQTPCSQESSLEPVPAIYLQGVARHGTDRTVRLVGVHIFIATST